MNDQGKSDVLSDGLRALAAAHGVATEFWDFHGNHRAVSAGTIVAVLAAMDVPAGNPFEVERSLAASEVGPWRRVLPPSVVVTAGIESRVPVHVPDGETVHLRVDLEGGGTRQLEQVDEWVEPRLVDGRTLGRATFLLPTDLPLGWHTLVAAVGSGDEVRTALAVTPAVLEVPELRAELGHRAWGLMAQLYSVRSERSWGIGDLADLTELTSLSGELGADFLLINPLHAAEPGTPMTPSPYLPATRRFVNPIYIRPEDIPEVAYLPNSQRTLLEWGIEEIRETNTDPGPLDRNAVWDVKKPALETIYASGRARSRQREFERFRRDQGQGLEDFALWCAVAEKYDATDWPLPVERGNAGQILALRRELSERVDFHCWLQWVADSQLRHAQEVARASGMRIGVMHDLAVGVHPEGADAWSMREVLAQGISVGAPPDMYNQQGQDWSQPPLRPDALAEQAYAPIRDMVRTVLRHAGALRVDHIIGLFRLWWIPRGAGADQGTYVRYDHEATIGVLALEAHRAGAIVIGEDLGTVEPWVRDYLRDRGILGTSVLWFERENDRPLPPEKYRSLVLSTVTTHDLPPTAGYLAEEHVDLRNRLGLLTEPVATVRLAAQVERERMLEALRHRYLLPEDPTERQIVEALHRYVAQTPSVLIGVGLADAVGERRAQNQPGTDTEYPNWKVPLADGGEKVVLVDDLPGNARFASLVAALTQELRERA
ncbi:4-alpha-glucanotransferase [Occultella glacieicola]|uniref:4-alpha-glucanotransferase n=1 Tax=Occultella glacieicola TaxID=2518684 RepID=A0ABY2EAS1_9MICO|nr:4-alpha-glucanotransferase [Occultella glacieicola]TDE97319.1 4-alpha-glucanotransferase [Occultella glacieicola]